MKDLFDAAADEAQKVRAPLADRMRPQTFDDLVGQEELVGPGKPLRVMVERDAVPSLILWGPPGSGKTTLAKVIAHHTKAHFIELSAVMAGVGEIRTAIREAEDHWKYKRGRTVLFIDEVHRFNKSQQDALLPHVERGTVTLIGATTENPSFECNAALLSRCKVFVLEKISPEAMDTILERVLKDEERGLGKWKIHMESGVREALVRVADGDARLMMNIVDMAVSSSPADKLGVIKLSTEHLKTVFQRRQAVYDKKGEQHYNIISALHKSLRGSDVNASLYWLGRMLEAGEDPLYVARRLVRFASEDIGMADPQALVQAVAGFQAAHLIGVPECNVILSQVTVYLAQAPKSNAIYAAYNLVQEDIRNFPQEPVPLHIRNAPTTLMKNLGYGKEYLYPPDIASEDQEKLKQQRYLPDRLKDRVYWMEKDKSAMIEQIPPSPDA